MEKPADFFYGLCSYQPEHSPADTAALEARDREAAAEALEAAAACWEMTHAEAVRRYLREQAARLRAAC